MTPPAPQSLFARVWPRAGCLTIALAVIAAAIVFGAVGDGEAGMAVAVVVAVTALPYGLGRAVRTTWSALVIGGLCLIGGAVLLIGSVTFWDDADEFDIVETAAALTGIALLVAAGVAFLCGGMGVRDGQAARSRRRGPSSPADRPIPSVDDRQW